MQMIGQAELLKLLTAAKDKNDCITIIKGMKTVDAMPLVHADFRYDAELNEHVCTNCGHMTCRREDMEDIPYKTSFSHVWRHRKPNYCKYCGAKMDAKSMG